MPAGLRVGEAPVDQAIGRSRGGWTTKLHALVADERTPLSLALSPGQAGDAPWGRELLRRQGAPANRPALVMDRAYADNATRALALALGYQPVVPPPSRRLRPWSYDRALYRRRNQVERFFRRLKRFRRIATRYDKLDILFLTMIQLAVIYDLLHSM